MKKIVLILLCVFVFLSASACGKFGNPQGDADYNRYPTDYDSDIDSWEQIEAGDEDVDVVWFTDYSFSGESISELIYKRTGVRVSFRSALSNDHSELTTMIAGNKLPDIISIDDTSLRIQLAEEGYCYAINKLAESYAPSMLKRVSQEHWDYYKSSDGNTYSIASHFYNDADIEELEELGAEQYTNGDLVVRKDYLEAYIAYRRGKDSSFDPDKEITKPSGFIEMAKWVKQTYSIPNSVPTVALSPFMTTGRNDKISESLTTAMEFFGVPREDSQGNLVYQYGTEEFVDVMLFFNELYREHLVISANFAYDTDDLTTLIINGRSFAYIGASQTIRSAFAKREKDAFDANGGTIPTEYEYVSIVLTDEEGNAPLMHDYTGRGMYNIMITKNCTREDRVIKVLDYLMSELGNREITYGEVEGEYYHFSVRPGEINPDTGKVSTYGVIEPTKALYNAVANSYKTNPTILGLGRISPLANAMYARLTAKYDDYAGITAAWHWPVYKFKKTYFDYSYTNYPFRYPLETSDRNALNTYSEQLADIEKVWIDALPRMIMAGSAEKVHSLYDEALSLSYSEGVEEYMAFRNKCFKAYKEYLGIDFAWPKADPAYTAPVVKLYGSADKYMNRPNWVYQETV